MPTMPNEDPSLSDVHADLVSRFETDKRLRHVEVGYAEMTASMGAVKNDVAAVRADQKEDKAEILAAIRESKAETTAEIRASKLNPAWVGVIVSIILLVLAVSGIAALR